MAVDDADLESDEIPSSYVPFRNANLLSMAVSAAEETNDCEAVFIGAHSEDFSGYPDCRPEFFEAFEAVVDVGTKPETEISIEAPFVDDSKTDIAERGVELEVPLRTHLELLPRERTRLWHLRFVCVPAAGLPDHRCSRPDRVRRATVVRGRNRWSVARL